MRKTIKDDGRNDRSAFIEKKSVRDSGKRFGGYD